MNHHYNNKDNDSHHQHDHDHDTRRNDNEQTSFLLYANERTPSDTLVEQGKGKRQGTSSTTTTSGGGGNTNVMKRLQIATGLCLLFLLVETVGGWWAGSLAILSDAAHLLADLAAFLVAMGATHLANLPSTQYHTFGLKRMESLAAMFSMVSLALVSIGLAVEAIRRLVRPPAEPVNGKLMSGIATIGVLVNIALAIVLGENHVHMPGAQEYSRSNGHDHNHEHQHQQHDGNENKEANYGAVLYSDEVYPEPDNDRIHKQKSDNHASKANPKKDRNVNLQAAYLHVMGDLAQSAAVLIAGIVIWMAPSWRIVDPICTLLFCGLVFYSTLGIIRSSIAVLLQEVPPNISYKDVYSQMKAVPGVFNVHDLHIWSISQGVPSLSVHVMTDTGMEHETLRNIQAVCQKNGISHATIQVQGGEDDTCLTCTPTSVDNPPATCAPYQNTAFSNNT